MEKGPRLLGGTQALLRDIYRIETWKRSKGQAHDFIQAIHTNVAKMVQMADGARQAFWTPPES